MKYIMLFILIFIVVLTAPTFASENNPIIAYHTGLTTYVLYDGTATLDDFLSVPYNVTAYETTTFTNTYSGVLLDNYMYAQKFWYSYDETIAGVSFVLGETNGEVLYQNKINITVKLCNASIDATPNLLSCHAYGIINYTDIKHTMTAFAQNPTGNINQLGLMQNVIFNQTVKIKGNSTATSQVGKYFIVIIPDRTTSLISSYYSIPYSNAGAYATGTMFTSTNGGTSWINQTSYDIHFELLSPTANQPALDAYSLKNQSGSYKMPLSRRIGVVGGELRISGGTVITLNQTAGTSNYFTIGQQTTAGGFINMTGTADNKIRVTQYGTITNTITTLVLSNGKLKMNWVDVNGYFASYGVVGTIGFFSHTDIRNSKLTNSYTSAGGYVLYNTNNYWNNKINILNTTLYRNDTAGSSSTYIVYNLYGMPNLINVNMTQNFGNTYGCMYLSGAGYLNAYQGAFGATCNGTNVSISNIRIYPNNTKITLGGYIKIKVFDSAGNAIPNATVNLVPQFYDSDSNRLGSYPADWDAYQSQTQRILLYDNNIDYPLSYITDANGNIADDYSEQLLYMKSKLYNNFNGILMQYISGSAKSLRPFNYEWKNDGTDYSYYLDVYKEGYLLNRTFLDSDYSYEFNITLTNTTAGSGSEFPMEILPLIAILTSFLLLWISRRIDNNDGLKILYFALSMVFVIVTIFTNIVLSNLASYTDLANIGFAEITIIVLLSVFMLARLLINFTKNALNGLYGEKSE